MKLIYRLCCISAVCFISACASSRIPAPVVGSSPIKPVDQDSYIESSPLPHKDPLQKQPVKKGKKSVSPVLRRLLAKSEAAREQQSWGESEAYLERALRIEPKNALVWHRLSLIKLEQSKNNQAIQFASKSNVLARGDDGLKRNNWSVIADANTALDRPIKADEARLKAQGF